MSSLHNYFKMIAFIFLVSLVSFNVMADEESECTGTYDIWNSASQTCEYDYMEYVWNGCYDTFQLVKPGGCGYDWEENGVKIVGTGGKSRILKFYDVYPNKH